MVLTYIAANIIANVGTNVIMDSIRKPGYYQHSSHVSVTGTGQIHHSTKNTYVLPSYSIPSINNPFTKILNKNKDTRVFNPFEMPVNCNPQYTCRGVICEEYTANNIDELDTKPGQACWVEIYTPNTNYYIIYRDRDGSIGLVPKYVVNVYGNLENRIPKKKTSTWKKFKNYFKSKPKITNEEAIKVFIANINKNKN